MSKSKLQAISVVRPLIVLAIHQHQNMKRTRGLGDCWSAEHYKTKFDAYVLVARVVAYQVGLRQSI